MNYWIGQGFGILSTLTDISIPQFKKKWQMLIANILVNTFLLLNLVFLGQIGSGIFLFAVAIVQAIINLIHTLREKPPKKWEIGLFFCLYVGLGFYGLVTAPGFVFAINGKNLLELLPIIGAVFSMLFVSTRDESIARRYLMVCNIMWAAYYTIIGYTSVFGAIFSGISCAIAMVRDKREKAKQSK
jgi:hypothetical protein